jgi:hypothetical protein
VVITIGDAMEENYSCAPLVDGAIDYKNIKCVNLGKPKYVIVETDGDVVMVVKTFRSKKSLINHERTNRCRGAIAVKIPCRTDINKIKVYDVVNRNGEATDMAIGIDGGGGVIVLAYL